MNNETGSDDPTPGLGIAENGAVIDAPMHYLFEIQLMTNQIVGGATEENRVTRDWVVKRQHVRRYLINYYKKHAMLPTGQHNFGMTRPRNLEIGMVDLGVIRQQIRADSEQWNGVRVESPQGIEDFSDHPLNNEIETGIRDQAAGKEPNGTISDFQQALTRRGKKPNQPRNI